MFTCGVDRFVKFVGVFLMRRRGRSESIGFGKEPGVVHVHVKQALERSGAENFIVDVARGKSICGVAPVLLAPINDPVDPVFVALTAQDHMAVFLVGLSGQGHVGASERVKMQYGVRR